MSGKFESAFCIPKVQVWHVTKKWSCSSLTKWNAFMPVLKPLSLRPFFISFNTVQSRQIICVWGMGLDEWVRSLGSCPKSLPEIYLNWMRRIQNHPRFMWKIHPWLEALWNANFVLITWHYLSHRLFWLEGRRCHNDDAKALISKVFSLVGGELVSTGEGRKSVNLLGSNDFLSAVNGKWSLFSQVPLWSHIGMEPIPIPNSRQTQRPSQWIRLL